MSGYIIFHYKIIDCDRIEELGPRALPMAEKHGGELVVGSYVTALEGSPYTHMVAYKFPTQEAAKSFFESAEHKELSKLRHEITEGFAFYVPEYKFD